MNQKTLFKLEYDKIIALLEKKRHLSAEDSSAVV